MHDTEASPADIQVNGHQAWRWKGQSKLHPPEMWISIQKQGFTACVRMGLPRAEAFARSILAKADELRALAPSEHVLVSPSKSGKRGAS